eukprot:319408_1
MARNFLILVAIIGTFVCEGATHRQRKGALLKQARHNGYNKRNSAKQMIDYDELLEEQEEHDLFMDDDYNNDDNEYDEYEENEANAGMWDDNEFDEYEEYQVPQRQRREYNDYNEHWAAQINSVDDSFDEDGDDSSESGGVSDKNQLTAFLLSFFLGAFGAGRFYVGDYTLGAIKLCLPLLVCIACVVACVVGGAALGISNLTSQFSGGGQTEPSSAQINGQRINGERINYYGCAAVLATCLLPCGVCAWQIWWFVDWILFACNQIPDGDGKTLIPW